MHKKSNFISLHHLTVVLSLILAVLISSSVATAQTLPPLAKPEAGKSYYLRHNIWVEKGRSRTSNYTTGKLVPFNTRVRLNSIGSKRIKLEIGGREVTIVNVKQHTWLPPENVAARLLSESKVSLNGVSKEFRSAIQSGNLRVGMTKSQAIITRGYPPRHLTSSLKANKWTYLSDRFTQTTIEFEKGKLVRGSTSK